MSRLKLEALTDKEPGQLETDGEEELEVKEEGRGGAEEGLPTSQPQPTTNQVLLEEEGLIIEEYDSDWHTQLHRTPTVRLWHTFPFLIVQFVLYGFLFN